MIFGASGANTNFQLYLVPSETKVRTCPDAIAGWLNERVDCLAKVSMETDPLAIWLWNALTERQVTIVCMDDPAQLTLNPPQSQRAVVVAADYSTDARVAADWLADRGIPIQFFKTVFIPQEERCLLDLSEINPPFMTAAQPGSARPRSSRDAVVAGPVDDKSETYRRFWELVMERFKTAGDERFGSGKTLVGMSFAGIGTVGAEWLLH